MYFHHRQHGLFRFIFLHATDNRRVVAAASQLRQQIVKKGRFQSDEGFTSMDSPTNFAVFAKFAGADIFSTQNIPIGDKKMKNVNKILLAITLGFAVLLVWAVVLSGDTQRVEAQKQVGCNVANVGGTYAYGAFGTIHPGNPVGFPPGPYNSAASLFLDGAGNYTVTAKTSYNGTIVDEVFEGEYTVGENCGVTFMFQGMPAVYAIFTNNRSETRAISTIPGTNITYLTVRK